MARLGTSLDQGANTTTSMDIKEQIEQISGDPAALEDLYRRAMQRGQARVFAEAVAECSGEAPDNVLLQAWQCRLDAEDPSADARSVGSDDARKRHWTTALGASVGTGALFALFAGGKPPVPVPDEANPLFWIGWAPLAAVAIMVFISVVAPQRERLRWCGGAAAVAVFAGLVSALVAWGRTDDAAVLVALHLPFVAWAVVGGGVALGRTDRALHFYAYIVQSMEALVAGGIFFGAGLLFSGLTLGIFAVFGIEFPEWVLRAAAAFGIGVIPVLAVASVYDPTVPPTEQRPTGLARILRIMTWLLLPAALSVLALYVVWFIPAYFWRPFDERSVLIVYNATIIAILTLLAAAVSPAADRRERTLERLLRPGVLSLSALTLLLNVYALAPILSRTLEYGLTPNRHAVLGWNVVTLLALTFLLARSWSAEPDDWLPRFRASMGRVMVLAVGWAAWVAWGLPLV